MRADGIAVMTVMNVAAQAQPGDKVPSGDGGAIRVLTITGLAFAGLTAIFYVWKLSWAGPIPRDASTLVVGRDFLNFWMYGCAAWLPDPSRFYDPHLYNDALAALLGPDYPGQNWSYPPTIMLLAAPFGRVGYVSALLCWTVAGLGIFIAVARRIVGERHLLIPILGSPAAVFCLVSGQSSLLTAAMLLTVMAWLDRRPLFAGILIGLLTMKPQLGLLFPVMLVASGRWRVFAVASVTALLLAAAATAVFGPQVWTDFVVHGLPAQNLVLADPDRIGTRYYPTIFMNLRGFGLSYAAAMAVQAVFTALAAGTVVSAYRRRKNADPQFLSALFFAATICAVPYLLSYDLLAVTCLAVMLLARGNLDTTGQTLAKLVYWLPLIQMIFGQYHVPGPALILPAFAIFLSMRLAQQRSDGASAAGQPMTPAALPASP
jgi:Glycosyltransferase family 87